MLAILTFTIGFALGMLLWDIPCRFRLAARDAMIEILHEDLAALHHGAGRTE